MFYRNRKAFQTYRMKLVDVKDFRNAGRAGWFHCFQATFVDELGVIEEGYSAMRQGVFKRDLGIGDYSEADSMLGQVYDVTLGVNCQFVRAQLVDGK